MYTEVVFMERNDFLALFMETGEPLYWLLSRAENPLHAPRTSQTPTAAEEELNPPAPQ